MSNVVPLHYKELMTVEELKRLLCESIDAGLIVLALVHRDEENVTDFFTNRDIISDRIGLKGILTDGLDILNTLTPVQVDRI